MTPGDTADQRLAILDHRRGWQLGVLGAVVTVMLSTILVVSALIEISETDLTSVSVDFYVFWAAAKLALQGLPLDAFDVVRIQEAAGIADSDWMPWAYPPGFLLLLTPFGLLPFAPAWAAFNVAGIGALLLAIRPFAAGRPQVLLAAALAPAMLPCLLVGQTTLLWAAGLVAALAALRAERPVLAGIFIGCLSLKPQLGLLIPVALVAYGAWRTILSAALTTAVLAAVPTAFFGTAYWPEMLAMMEAHGEKLRSVFIDLQLMISPYSAFAVLGLPEPLALRLQAIITAVCVLLVFLAWRSKRTSFDLRAAVLLTAIPLASPYLWFYESALLAPAALFMLRAGCITLRPASLILGLAMWLGLGPSVLVLLKTGETELFRLVFLPIALAAFGTCLRYAFVRPGPAAATSEHSQ